METQTKTLFKSIQFIQEGLKLYRDAKFLYQEGKTLKEVYQKMTVTPVEDRKQISESLKSNKLQYNDFVKTEGILIDYTHLYRPITYINALAYQPKPSPLYPNQIPLLEYEPFQLPISKIPYYSLSDNEEIGLAFLYPVTFSSFIYPAEGGLFFSTSTTHGERIIDPNFSIPEYAKPIPVILSRNDLVNNRFKRVELTGQISVISEKLQNHLLANSFSTMVFSEIINPLGPSFCLDITKNKSQIKPMNHAREHLRSCTSSIYFECHIEGRENCPELSLEVIIRECFPSNQHSGTSSRIGDIHQMVSSSSIRFVAREPNFLGFYRVCDLAQPAYFEAQFKELRKTVFEFEKNLQKLDKGLTLHIDFMFDYAFKNSLKTDLLNGEVINNIQNDESLKQTISWLKGE
ncbi:hypothetical protein [Bacillus cereus group sp. MYBK35-2]|uniref:hypothetical protein n=1 Tax=unclassified Bacillus cereus group TaxID=2750818 RepID=UPI0029F07D2F|nr:hypothetical protein [Bacillus cereus]MDA2314674.1 hypothetical protein [Bacillus cereus]MDA2499334.1 hypothetical protein [Bacillus cereus]